MALATVAVQAGDEIRVRTDPAAHGVVLQVHIGTDCALVMRRDEALVLVTELVDKLGLEPCVRCGALGVPMEGPSVSVMICKRCVAECDTARNGRRG